MLITIQRKPLLVCLILGSWCLIQASMAELNAQSARKTGKLAGVITDKGESKTMNNGWVQIRADGEEGKGRRYWPAADPQVGGPNREILAAIRAVAIGTRVEVEWIDAGDGKDLTKFQVLKGKQ